MKIADATIFCCSLITLTHVKNASETCTMKGFECKEAFNDCHETKSVTCVRAILDCKECRFPALLVQGLALGSSSVEHASKIQSILISFFLLPCGRSRTGEWCSCSEMGLRRALHCQNESEWLSCNKHGI